jgi:tripartite-type tricarboxylate transporter receptor subunit TctC
VTSRQRVQSLPNVPTLQEQGLKNFRSRGLARALRPERHAQAGPGQAERRAAGVGKGRRLQGQVSRARCRASAADKATPDSLQKHLKAEVDKWGPIIKKAGVYAD